MKSDLEYSPATILPSVSGDLIAIPETIRVHAVRNASGIMLVFEGGRLVEFAREYSEQPGGGIVKIFLNRSQANALIASLRQECRLL